MNVVPNFFWQNKHTSFNKLNFGETYETFEKPSLNVFPLDSLQFSKLTFSLTFFDNERNAFLVITNVNGGYVVLYLFATIISVCVCVCVCVCERERKSVCVCMYVRQREREKKVWVFASVCVLVFVQVDENILWKWPFCYSQNTNTRLFLAAKKPTTFLNKKIFSLHFRVLKKTTEREKLWWKHNLFEKPLIKIYSWVCFLSLVELLTEVRYNVRITTYESIWKQVLIVFFPSTFNLLYFSIEMLG